MPDCLFCKIIQGEIPSHKIYEDDDVYVFLNINPMSKGAALIIPKEHATDMNSGSVEAAEAMMRTTYKISPAILKTLGASGYNLGMNHGADAGQEVFHSHLHFMPRYPGDERKYEKLEYSQEELADIAEQIRNEI
ncbi:MAG: HIT family protein [bacterium]